MPRLSTETHQSNDHLTLLRKAEVARCLGVSTWTLDRWVKVGKFPPPIYLTAGSPAAWRVSDLDAFLQKRRVARRIPPKVRGMLKRMADEA